MAGFSASDFNRKLREAQRQAEREINRQMREAQRQAEREIKREVDRVNRANEKAVADYNRKVEAHNKKVVADYNAQVSQHNRQANAHNTKVIDDLNRQLRSASSSVRYTEPERKLADRVHESVLALDPREYDTFLSYARIDGADTAAELRRELECLGVAVWFDEVAIVPGRSQSLQMDAGLRKARSGIALLTPAYLAGRFWTERELGALLGKFASSGTIETHAWLSEKSWTLQATGTYAIATSDFAYGSGAGVTTHRNNCVPTDPTDTIDRVRT